jgi:methyltransferase (TIGR00027 family)
VDEHLASRTALATALMRARHARLDPKPLIDDRWGDRLVPQTVRDAIRNRAWSEVPADLRERARASPGSIVDEYLRNSAAYANVIVRSRYAEDALAAAVSSGIRQYVMIGAGFDSFALRRPSFARDLAVYEIDHPATQGLKRRRMAECGVAAPPATYFVAADLGKEDLRSALSRSPFHADRGTFFSWLGVTMYLTREANLAALRAIATSASAGSELVFTYLDGSALEPGSSAGRFQALSETVASLGEPFLSGFNPSTLRQELLQVGLELIEDLTGPQLLQRYDREGINGLQTMLTSHIARARIAL